jgi:hypothetical protein
VLITTRTLGNSALRSPLAMLRKYFEQHRAGNDLATSQRFQFPRRADLVARLHRHHEDDVAVDFGFDLAPAQAEPIGDFALLGVPAAPPEAYLAKIIERRLDLDPLPGTAPVGVADVRVRQFGKIGLLEHLLQGLHEVAVAALARRALERGMRRDLGAEIVIVVAQPLERFEIIVVIDRRQHVAEPAEFFAVLVAVECAVFEQSELNVALADRNELIETVVRRVMGNVGHHGSAYMVRASAVKALRESGLR